MLPASSREINQYQMNDISSAPTIISSSGRTYNWKDGDIMRLPNSFGSVYKLSGNRRNPWCARKTTGWKDNGQPIYKYVGYYPTRQDALTALVDYNKDPYDLQLASITFDELYERWSEVHFQKIKPNSAKGYLAAYNTCDAIGKMRVVDIKLDHLQRVIDDSGKNTPTLKNLKNMLGLMWDYAVIHEILTQDKRDMIRYLDISKPGNPDKRSRTPFTHKQIRDLWNRKDDNEYISVVLIMIYTGVRIGELLSLEKQDIHLDEKWLYVKEAKTAAGIREVPIADKIVPLMEYWLSKPCSTLVCSINNQPVPYDTFLDSYWYPVMDLLLMDHKPHDTRHTCISLLTEAGVDQRIIRKIAGHKGQGVTETVYTHLELPIKLEAINKI